MNGYIKLWRSLAEHPLWTRAPEAWLKVALGMLIKANWKPARWDDGRREVLIPAGSFATSIPSMAAFCRVSEKQYRIALGYMVRIGFVAVTRAPRYHIVSITNWATYQAEDVAEGRQEGDERAGSGQDEGSNRRREEGKEAQEVKETDGRDIDCPATNHKNRDSRPGVVSLPPSTCKQHPQVREFLMLYMMEPDDLARYNQDRVHFTGEKIYPTDRHVVEVMDAANGASEYDVCLCLKHLYEERSLRPGTKHGPRTFAWFPTVVQEYFEKRAARDEVANPKGSDHWTADGSEWTDRLSEAER